MDESFQLLKNKYLHLIESKFVSFQDVALLNTTGVYVIYDENEKIIYIGSTNKFHVRFGTDLKHESTHTLVRKLIKNGEHVDRYSVSDYLNKKCLIKIEECNSKREAEALEHIAIYFLNPRLNK